MKRVLFACIIGNLSLQTYAQDMWSRAVSMGTTYSDDKNPVCHDANGNFYYGGNFTEPSVVSGVALTAAGDRDFYFAKYDANDVLLWVKDYGGPGNEQIANIHVDNAGNIYACGSFGTSLSIGGTVLPVASAGDMFLAKFDPAGNLVWVRQIGGVMSQMSCADDIRVDGSGNVYLTGYLHNTADFGGVILTSAGLRDIFLAKYDNNGNLIWVKKAGGSQNDETVELRVAPDGSAYVAGYFYSTNGNVSGIPLPNNGLDDIVLIKYLPNGNVAWVRTYGSTGEDVALSVELDAAGNVYMSGYFQNTLSVGPYTLTNGTGWCDAFVIKHAPNGTVLWAKQGLGDGSYGADLAYNPVSDEIIMSGYFMGNEQFGPYAITANDDDEVLAVAYSTGGTEQWVKNAYGNGLSRSFGVSANPLNGAVYISGNYADTCTFDCITLIDTSWGFRNYWGKIFDIPMAQILTPDTALCDIPPVTVNLLSDADNELFGWSSSDNPDSILSYLPQYTANITGSSSYYLHFYNCIIDTVNIVLGNGLSDALPDTYEACQGDSVLLHADINNATYLWNNGVTTQNQSVNQAGSYWVQVNVGNCVAYDSTTVLLYPLPVVNLGSDTALCETVSVSIPLSISLPGASYLWSTGDTGNHITATQFGLYTATVTVNGCSATDSLSITGKTVPVFTLGNDVTVCEGEPVLVTLSAETAGAVYLWGDSSTSAQLTVTQPGLFYVTVSVDSCSSSDSLTVSIQSCDTLLAMPNIFTPNGGGPNELFHPIAYPTDAETIVLSIYNRWGNLLYKSTDMSTGWNGCSPNGLPCPSGVYFWIVEYSNTGTVHMQNGFLHLAR